MDTNQGLTNFEATVIDKLARIEEYTRPLPARVEEHTGRINRLENRQYKIAVIATSFGVMAGYIVQPIAHFGAFIADIFKG